MQLSISYLLITVSKVLFLWKKLAQEKLEKSHYTFYLFENFQSAAQLNKEYLFFAIDNSCCMLPNISYLTIISSLPCMLYIRINI